MFGVDGDVLRPDPGGIRYPLPSERLQIFNGMMGGIVQEAPDQMQTFIVRDVGGGLIPSRLSVRILIISSADCFLGVNVRGSVHGICKS